MKLIRLAREHNFDEWRAAARALLMAGTPPDEVRWQVSDDDLFAPAAEQRRVTGRAVGVVPKRFLELGQIAIFHRDPLRFALLYRLLFRLQKDHTLLTSRADPDVARLHKLVLDMREENKRATVERNLPPPSSLSPPRETMEGPVARGIAEKQAAEITSLADARAAVQGCTRCPLYQYASQAVFGEGPKSAEVMFVGEQPGDQEDLAGRPFVGPAGQLFDAALEKAGIDRSTVYVTNAVKHFKFVQRGKRRIHNKPDSGEIEACRWWIEHERELIRPPVTVALGATAARSLLDKAVTISRVRGAPLKAEDGSEVWVTVHPSFLLRIPEEDRKREERALFVRDLKRIKQRADELAR